MALPYSSLVKLSLKTDETVLELSYVTHRVTVIGGNLGEVYRAVAEAEARVVTVVAVDWEPEMTKPPYPAIVREIRIEPLDADERRKR